MPIECIKDFLFIKISDFKQNINLIFLNIEPISFAHIAMES